MVAFGVRTPAFVALGLLRLAAELSEPLVFAAMNPVFPQEEALWLKVRHLRRPT